MVGGTAFGRVDDAAGKQGVAGTGEVARGGERLEAGEEGGAEVRLGEVEMQAGQVEGQALKAVGLGGEQLGEGLRFDRLDRVPGSGFVHAALLEGEGGDANHRRIVSLTRFPPQAKAAP
jgi:hypothetical protein